MLVCRRKMATKDTNIELYRNILSPTEIKFMGKIFINFLHELGHLEVKKNYLVQIFETF